MSKRRGTHDLLEEGGRVERVERCVLTVCDRPWSFVAANRAAIDAHWAKRSAETPGFFNGVVYMMVGCEFRNKEFRAQFRPVEFKSFLYWRETGYPDPSVWDAFGSALIRSVEGHVLLGVQSTGNLNTGLAYLPGGFIDPRDVDEHGRIDIAANVRREIREETGLGDGDLDQVPGFIVTQMGAHVSIAMELASTLRAHDLRQKILGHIAADQQPELSDIVIIEGRDDVVPETMPEFTAVLLMFLFG